MLRPEEAVRVILGVTPRLDVETATVAPALAGRVLAADAVAGVSLPPFATSAMDGFAVRAHDLGDGPIAVAFRIAAGDRPSPLPDGSAAAIATGAPLPDGADSIIPIEDGEEQDGHLRAEAPERGAWVRAAGSDVAAGDVILSAGSVLAPAGLAALAAAGVAQVTVSRRPRLAAIATGSELQHAGRPLEPGQIYESNLTAMAVQTARAGAELVATEVVPDDRAAIREAFAAGLRDADVVVSSGGVSVGPHDHVKPVLEDLGVRERFWRVAHRPGKPLWFGTAGNGTLVFGLPGNPVSSLVCFELFVRPALLAMQGAPPPARARARLAEPIARLATRDHAVRCSLIADEDGMRLVAQPAQDSHLIAHAAAAGAIAMIPAGEGVVEAGTVVEYVLL
ncbi:MAG TPA: gephyrin-like molybdotransferase Glp [Gaiellales bacterium]|nr:gephyrin-like molybdotransferase Glp [Gaiellales bacterium]